MLTTCLCVVRVPFSVSACMFVCVCVSLSASALVACITVNGSPWPPHRNASWVSSLRRATVPNECTSVICKSLSPFATVDIPIPAWGQGGPQLVLLLLIWHYAAVKMSLNYRTMTNLVQQKALLTIRNMLKLCRVGITSLKPEGLPTLGAMMGNIRK